MRLREEQAGCHRLEVVHAAPRPKTRCGQDGNRLRASLSPIPLGRDSRAMNPMALHRDSHWKQQKEQTGMAVETDSHRHKNTLYGLEL